jgi:hypothetical protein
MVPKPPYSILKMEAVCSSKTLLTIFTLRGITSSKTVVSTFIGIKPQISNSSAALENSDAEVGINSIWETIRHNFKISAKESLGYSELKQQKPCLDKGCSKLLDQRKKSQIAVVTGSKQNKWG